jgi:hypothetical protein
VARASNGQRAYRPLARWHPAMNYPTTPDGRYFVVRGRLWRSSDPRLDADRRRTLTAALMRARRDVATAKKRGDAGGLRDARDRVHAAKVELGERGPVWWDDGAPDYGRRMARNSPYAAWYAALAPSADADA